MPVLNNTQKTIWADDRLGEAGILSRYGVEVCMSLKEACNLCLVLVSLDAACAVNQKSLLLSQALRLHQAGLPALHNYSHSRQEHARARKHVIHYTTLTSR